MRALALALAVAVSGCATTSPILVTGETLDAAAVAMESTAAGMRSLDDSGHLSLAQVKAWNTFLTTFKLTFDLSCDLWRAAHASGNETIEQQAAAIAATLIAGIGPFTDLLAKSAAPSPGGSL